MLQSFRALALVLLAALPASAQWQPNGNDIYFDGGKVGIGTIPTTGPWTGQLVVSTFGSGGNAVLAEYDGNGTALTAKTGSGTGLYAFATSGSAVNYAVYATTSSPYGYAGYFHGGKNYFQGSVGVGSTSPQAKLHVSGSASNGMVLNADNQLYVNQSLDFVGVGRNSRVTSSEVFGIYKPGNSWGGMYCMTSGSSGAPFYGYSAGGDVDAYHYYSGSGKWWALYMGGLRLTIRRSDGFLQNHGNAAKPGGGSWAVLSDRRLKRDVRALERPLERLLALRGVTYEYVDPEAVHELSGVQIGMIAQEVEETFPGWVDEGEDGYKRLTFRGFEAVAVEALRELRDETDREIASLRAQNAALEARLARLEAALLGR